MLLMERQAGCRPRIWHPQAEISGVHTCQVSEQTLERPGNVRQAWRRPWLVLKDAIQQHKAHC
jgi:hypothetical protein